MRRDDGGQGQPKGGLANSLDQRTSAYNLTLIEASVDPLVTISPDGKITDVNTATERVTGCSRDELIGTEFSDYFTDPERARAGYQQVFKDGFVKDYELGLRHRDGNVTPVNWHSVSVYRDELGDIVGVFAAAGDISSRKQAEELLRRAHTELEQRVRERTAELQLANEKLLREIEDRERAEAELETTLRRFYTILSSMYAGVLLVTDRGSGRVCQPGILPPIRSGRSATELRGMAASK